MKTHLQAMRLLALLVEDYFTLAATSSSADPAAVPLLVPAHIRDGLVAMLVGQLQQRRGLAGFRQAYVDLTHGNANWKLGLYSRGEVHRRGATDRVDRNDVVHLLQNEAAMLMLQAVLELGKVTAGPASWSQAEAESFFAPLV
ncbi:hypothetical protein STCU_12047 [Strigomonas culicis]|uniref:Pre-mRNA-splicing factor 18 n=1 Tax=Strigomonas culicis TaxID=28005 RepID=S9UL46_9TRYP|nr:hypothetical protein STCU_12047 [Strigomonas culicis]|eukprot:EPY15411.1 hypothetical protein STCU_12047 [Strigomonas culicis]